MVMPAFLLGLGTMGALTRLTRSAVLEIRSEDYVRTAYSKGLNTRKIYVRHILRNAALPLIRVIGVSYGYMLGGSIFIEFIFAWPGMGQLLQQAIGWRDYPLIQAIAFFTSVVVVALNMLTDVAYAFIDPRIRFEG
jgi:peptide/nickel transport system permease protein